MKKLIAASMLLSSVSAFAGPYSIKFPKPLVLNGTSLMSVEKVENKAGSNGKWTESSSGPEKQNCEFAITVEGRDMAVEKASIGEHYYGSMTVKCEKAGLFGGGGFQTNFSRVLLLGIRDCVSSETVIDNDYCNLQVLALRKETDMNTKNGDLISDKPTARKFYRIHSVAAAAYAQNAGLIPSGVNQSLIDSYQSFTLSIGRNGNEFFLPSQNEKSSFISGRNIFLKVSNEDLNRDADLRNKIEESLKGLQDEINSITTGAKPADVFKAKIGTILGTFSTTVQKLLGIISPVEFFQLEKQVREFEANLIATSKTFNPNVTNRDSFKSNYGAQAASLSVMMDYLNSRSTKGGSSNTAPVVVTPTQPIEAGLAQLGSMNQASFEKIVTGYFSKNSDSYYYVSDAFAFYRYYFDGKLGFTQFKTFLKLVSSPSVKNDILESFYYKYCSVMVKKDFDEILTLVDKNDPEATGLKNALTQHWKAVFEGQ